MDKVDLLVLPLTYLLRMTVTLLYLADSLTSRVYNYWFNTSDNAQMREDVSAWTIHITLRAIMALLYALHILIKF